MSGPTVTVELTDEMIDRAVVNSLRTRHYDEDGDYTESFIDVSALIRERIVKMVDKAIAETARDTAADVVRERVELALDEGFPVVSQWGESTDKRKTLAAIVGGIVFQKDRYNDGIETMIRKRLDAEVRAQVAAHIKDISGEIGEAMKSAAADALSTWMKKTIGMRS